MASKAQKARPLRLTDDEDRKVGPVDLLSQLVILIDKPLIQGSPSGMKEFYVRLVRYLQQQDVRLAELESKVELLSYDNESLKEAINHMLWQKETNKAEYD